VLRFTAWITLVTCAQLFACTAADTPDEADTADASVDTGPPPEPVTPEMLVKNHQSMFEAVKANLAAPEMIVDGQWQEHYGDAQLYGPSFDLAWWKVSGDTAHYERGLAALEFNLAKVQEAIDNPIALLSDVQNTAMALLALIQSGQYVSEPTYHEAADALIAIVDSFAEPMGDYLNMQSAAVPENPYGPTAISAFLAMMHLEHALAYPDHEFDAHIARADQIIANIHKAAWSDELGAYRYAPGDDKLYLYPQIMMMLVNARAHQLTQDPKYLEQVELIYTTIQPLKDATGDHYHSPYSAGYMGAEDEDYSTLSSQNYTMMALWLAFVGGGDPMYLADVDAILGFAEKRLLQDGQILHHWMNGAAASKADTAYYCSGCNLQTLYMMTLFTEAVEPPESTEPPVE
jgi:uncharacterized protein YyaL (SSP411 family)